ncbi:MAG: hypothetical protein J7L74_02665 [Candidatus Hydrothermae bacterium]|nr:hypothetical protein [Candidatus Hydrothermae bacterium]
MKVKGIVGGLVVLFALSSVLWAADCVEVDIEAPQVAYLGQTVVLSGELTNCGDEAEFVELSGFITNGVDTLHSPAVSLYLAAGETKSRAVSIHIPNVPQLVGTYTACVVARIGTAESTDCATMQILEGGRKPVNTQERKIR